VVDNPVPTAATPVTLTATGVLYHEHPAAGGTDDDVHFAAADHAGISIGCYKSSEDMGLRLGVIEDTDSKLVVIEDTDSKLVVIEETASRCVLVVGDSDVAGSYRLGLRGALAVGTEERTSERGDTCLRRRGQRIGEEEVALDDLC
jgi:hypothetical protein